MKSFLKKSILAGLLVLSCSGTVLAAPTVENVVNDLGTLGSFYTLYPEMPIADYEENWDGIAGWTKKTRVYDEFTRMDMYNRNYKIDNKLVHEGVSVQVFKKFNAVKRVWWSISSKDPKVIEKIFYQIYDKMASQYPEMKDRIPRGYTPINGFNNSGKHPWCYINDKTATMGFTLTKNDLTPGKVVYCVALDYSSEIWR